MLEIPTFFKNIYSAEHRDNEEPEPDGLWFAFNSARIRLYPAGANLGPPPPSRVLREAMSSNTPERGTVSNFR